MTKQQQQQANQILDEALLDLARLLRKNNVEAEKASRTRDEKIDDCILKMQQSIQKSREAISLK